MNCEQIKARLTQYALGDLDEKTSAEVRAHLEKCDGCRAALREVEPTLDLLRSALAATSKAPERLSRAHRTRIVDYSSPAKRAILWITQGHPGLVAAAALVVLGFILVGMMLPAMFGSRELTQPMMIRRTVYTDRGGHLGFPAEVSPVRDEIGAAKEVQIVEPEAIEELAELEPGDELAVTYFDRPEEPAVRKALPSTGRPVQPTERFASKDADPGDTDDLEAGEAGRPASTRDHYAKYGVTVTPPDPEPVEEVAGQTLAWDNGEGLARDRVAELRSVMKERPQSEEASRAHQELESLGIKIGGGVDAEEDGAARDERAWAVNGKSLKVLEESAEKADYVTKFGWKGKLARRRHAVAAKKEGGAAPESRSERSNEVGAYLDLRESQAEVFDQAAAGPGERVGRELAADSLSGARPAPALKPSATEKGLTVTELRVRTRNQVGPDTVEPGIVDELDVEALVEATYEEVEETQVRYVADATAAYGKLGAGAPAKPTEVGKDVDAPADKAGIVFASPDLDESKVYEEVDEDTAGAELGYVAGAFTVNGRLGASAAEGEEHRRIPVPAPKPPPAAEPAPETPLLGELPVLGELFVADVKKAGEKAEAEERKREREEELTGPRFKAVGVNPFHNVVERAFSTFSIDVDTAAYTLARNYMMQGQLPPAEAVRTEEFVNFFDYAYKPPARGTFRIYTECAPSKFGRGLHMLKIGVKGRRLGREEQRRAVLTFVLDTSGSMNQPDRIDLAKKSLKMLVERLNPRDLIAIVQYDSHARLVLEHTPASEKERILQVIDGLQCGGSTNLEEGMDKAYEIASRGFVGGGENRVLLVSDGVANLGTVAAEDILKKVAKSRKQGIYCSIFGFGMGTYDDAMLETLANKGDGAYTFIDSEDEARRVFVDDLAATLNTIAADVKIQVEFNPKHVKRYRQLGYENRQLKKEDFRDDTVDAGEVGSGQSVTALYEVEMGGVERPTSNVQPARNATHSVAGGRPTSKWEKGTIAVVRVRYRRTADGKVEEIEREIREADIMRSFDDAPSRFRLAACVAEFAEILRTNPFATGSEYEDVAKVLRPVALDLHLDRRVQELWRMVHGAQGMARAEY